MCTVTVIPWRGTVRLAANRDEARSRPAALPPEVRALGDRQAILPLDPVGGGTWVAASDAGLAMTVLNVTTLPARRMIAPRSRGVIIPVLLSADGLGRAVELAEALDTREYAPFRLVLADRRECVEFRSDGGRLRLVRRVTLTEPLLFTSSGLGDALVEGPRAGLFARRFEVPDWAAVQEAFHRHSWPGRPHLSVCMSRPDARTVSHTLVTLAPDAVSLSYHPDAPDRPATRTQHTISLWPGGSR